MNTLTTTESIDFIVPAHNEGGTVGDVVSACIASLDLFGPDSTVTVVADHCVDKTASIARSLGASVVELSSGQPSKSTALRSGVDSTCNAWLFFVDADCVGLTDEHLATLAGPVLNGQATMSVGVFDYRLVRGLVQRFPWSTGERVLPRRLFEQNDDRMIGYNAEVLLNEAVGKEGGTTASFVMTGVRQVSKVRKSSFLDGIRGDVAMWRQISRSITDINGNNYREYMHGVRVFSGDRGRDQPSVVVGGGYLALRGLSKILAL